MTLDTMDTMDTLETFCSMLGLDETAKNVLINLPDDAQREALQSFNAEGSSNVSARFVTYCKKLTGKLRDDYRQDEEQITQFVNQWGLDDRAQKLLEGAKQEVRDYVYGNFMPTAKTENVNKLFTAFIKKAMDANITHQARLSERSTIGTHHTDRRSERGSERRVSTIPESRITSRSANLKDLANFIRRYKLDFEASALLLDLKETIREDVMDSFAPPDQDEYSKLFTSFAISRVRGAKKPGDRDGERGGRRDETPRRKESSLGLKRERDDDISDFVARWNLDEDCLEMLRSMTSTLRSDIMRDFDPPANVMNVNKSFTGFARSRGAKTEERSFKRKREERDEREERNSSRTILDRVTSNDIEQFIMSHGLDAKCQEVLLGLPSRVQADCVSTFEGCKEGNVNKLFMGFAKMKREQAERSR